MQPKHERTNPEIAGSAYTLDRADISPLIPFRHVFHEFRISQTEIRVAKLPTQEGRELDDNALASVNSNIPNRRLDAEMAPALRTVRLQPACLRHLAISLFSKEVVHDTVFVTSDEQQETAATDLGLAIT